MGNTHLFGELSLLYLLLCINATKDRGGSERCVLSLSDLINCRQLLDYVQRNVIEIWMLQIVKHIWHIFMRLTPPAAAPEWFILPTAATVPHFDSQQMPNRPRGELTMQLTESFSVITSIAALERWQNVFALGSTQIDQANYIWSPGVEHIVMEWFLSRLLEDAADWMTEWMNEWMKSSTHHLPLISLPGWECALANPNSHQVRALSSRAAYTLDSSTVHWKGHI